MKKIILALDNLNLEEAINIASQVKNELLTVKVGLELFNNFSKAGIQKFNKIGINNLMLDLKLNDIPITIKRAILALKGVKFGYLTVMSLGGNEMIKEAKKAANEIDPNIKILAVTILTSLSKNQLSEMGFNLSVEETVLKLAKNSNGADGYVCSALEAKLLRKEFPNKIILCPGLRLPDDSKNDQKRIATPAQAIQNGADACIMGRSLLKGDINKNLEKVLNSIK